VPFCSTRRTIGHTGDRTSSLAARFMTPTSSVSETAGENLSKFSTRCTEP